MIINNVRLSLRHLGRQKLNTALHIVGLTLGMSVCLLIGLLYAICPICFVMILIKTQFVSQSLRTGITGLENITLAHPVSSSLVEINPQKRFLQKNILVAEPEILDIFNIEVIAGNGHDALRKPYYALLTETTAKKFFGKENPIGKTFRYKNEFNITVGGLIRDQPSNTHLPASMLLSFVADKRFLGMDADNWGMIRGNSTFVVLPELLDIKHLEAQLKGIADKNINSDPSLPKDIRCDFKLQPLQSIHFQPKYGGGGPWVQAVNTTWLWFFAMIGILVLVLACINFINLSTAQALTRAKEVGVRKSVGAGRFQLIAQFLMESCMLALIAGILSISVAQTCLPAMNTLLDKGIVFNLLQSPELLGALLVSILLTGLLAGLYPAWLIARFNPTANLKPGSMTTQNIGSSMLRKVLVVVQFTISIGLLIAVGLIAQQISYIRGKNLGFNKENVINLPIGNVARASAFAAALNQIPQVKHFSFATHCIAR